MRRRFLLFTALPLPLAAHATLSAPDPFADVPICRGVVAAQYVQRGPSDPDADLLEKLGLLEGHLVIGRQLLEASENRLAIPHFGHPVQELMGYLESRLAARGVPNMRPELDVLADGAESRDWNVDGRFVAAWNALMPKMRQAAETVPAAKRASPRFMLRHLALMAYNVASDYGEAIERGRITNLVEYHDSMGFLAYAITTAAAQSGPGFDEAKAELEGLRRDAYPRLIPSPRPPISISEARSRAARLQALAASASA